MPLLWGKHRPDVGKASPCVCALGNIKTFKGMRNTRNTHLATQNQRRAPSQLSHCMCTKDPAWDSWFLGRGVPQRYTTGLHAKRVNCLLRDPPQVRYWLDLDIGSGISKNPWNTKQGLRKRTLQGSAHGSLLQPGPKFHGAGPCTHTIAIIERAENGWKLHNPQLLTTNRDGVAICGWVSDSKHGNKYQEIRTPSRLS